MMFKGEKIFDASFDVYANNYHSVRPGYPEEMYDDVQRECGVTADSRLLEIGSGSGIATLHLAKLGSTVVGIEPGSNLASIAREEVKNFPNVEIVEDTFENYTTGESFDVVLALTAFHWLDEDARYQHALKLLKKSGSLAIVWNSFFQSDSPATIEVNALYDTLLPDVYAKGGDVNTGVLAKLSGREKEIAQSDVFYTAFLRKYVTNYQYDTKTYPMLLNTFPKIVKIEEEVREQFLAAVASVVERYGTISVPVLTTLLVCGRRDYLLEEIGANKKGGNE